MVPYEHLYYSLFNDISDLIQEMKTKSFSQKASISALEQIQKDSEERFLSSSEQHDLNHQITVHHRR